MKRYYKNLIKSTLLGQLFQTVKLNSFRRKWIKKNKCTQLFPMNMFDSSIVKAGKHSYGELNVVSFGNEATLTIGNYVSIAENVYFLLDVEHYIDHISTYPFRVKLLQECKSESFAKGNIVVEDDVWIGFGAVIMSGVIIGKGAIVGAGALVTKNVPPYAIVVGTPAKVIRYRFPDTVQKEIQKIDYASLTEEKVEKHKELLYSPVTEDNAKKFIELLMQ